MFNRKSVNLLISFLAVAFFTTLAMAAEGETPRPDLTEKVKFGLALAAGLGIGLASFGGALGQGRAIGSALEGIARNPGAQMKVFIPLLVGLAFVESLVIFSLFICLGLANKI